MKLIIDIPEEVKETFDKADNINFCFYDYNSVIGKAIRNGTPLDDIKAEIKTACTDNYGNEKDISYEHIAYIIDKHIGKEKP